MNAFVEAIKNNRNVKLTENAGITFDSSESKLVDFFFAVGALRGQSVDRLIKLFEDAFAEDPESAVRIMLWARDAREGAGERKIFRDLLNHLEKTHIEVVEAILPYIPEFGRWDDLLVFENPLIKEYVFGMISYALQISHDGLCAKWMPRKGKIAVELKNYMHLTPKQYRKLLVELTNVVETQMCSKQWDKINYEHVPSVAASRYNKAFLRNDPIRYQEYGKKAVTGEAKINASAVYPYDVLRSIGYYGNPNVDLNVVRAQWDALPNYMGDENILPIVDVSSSMTWTKVAGNLEPYDIAVGLGLYCADKSNGAFKDVLMTFSSDPKLYKVSGTIEHKLQTVKCATVHSGTDIQKAIEEVLRHGIKHNVPAKDMPGIILILSDMEFNQCIYGNFAVDTKSMIAIEYANAGYKVPKIVFWNLNSRQSNVPVKMNEQGVALVSGFSPSIVKSILKADTFTPYGIMMETIMKDRYDIFN